MHQVTQHSGDLGHIDIEIGHSCNLNCIHCSACAGAADSEKALSLTEIMEILRNARSVGLSRVGLTGGEPLMDMEKLIAVVDYCHDQLGVLIHIHTNGTLVNETMVKAGGVLTLFEAISVTFLSGDAQSHDRLTGKRGAFEQAMFGARVMAEAGLPLTCFFVPFREMCGNVGHLVQELVDIGVKRIRVLALAPSGRARPIYREHVPDTNEIRQLETSLLDRAAVLGLDVEAGYCTRQLLPRVSALSGHETCTSAINRLHISFEGDVYPCTAASGVDELKVGNVRQCGLRIDQLWRESRKLDAIRSARLGLLAECRTCTTKQQCQHACIVNVLGTMDQSVRNRCPLAKSA